MSAPRVRAVPKLTDLTGAISAELRDGDACRAFARNSRCLWPTHYQQGRDEQRYDNLSLADLLVKAIGKCCLTLQ